MKSLSDGPDAGFGCILPVFVFYSVLRLFPDPKHRSKILEKGPIQLFPAAATMQSCNAVEKNSN